MARRAPPPPERSAAPHFPVHKPDSDRACHDRASLAVGLIVAMAQSIDLLFTIGVAIIALDATLAGAVAAVLTLTGTPAVNWVLGLPGGLGLASSVALAFAVLFFPPGDASPDVANLTVTTHSCEGLVERLEAAVRYGRKQRDQQRLLLNASMVVLCFGALDNLIALLLPRWAPVGAQQAALALTAVLTVTSVSMLLALSRRPVERRPVSADFDR